MLELMDSIESAKRTVGDATVSAKRTVGDATTQVREKLPVEALRPKQKRRSKRFTFLLVIAAVVGVAFVVRRMTASKDAQPSADSAATTTGQPSGAVPSNRTTMRSAV